MILPGSERLGSMCCLCGLLVGIGGEVRLMPLGGRGAENGLGLDQMGTVDRESLREHMVRRGAELWYGLEPFQETRFPLRDARLLAEAIRAATTGLKSENSKG